MGLADYNFTSIKDKNGLPAVAVMGRKPKDTEDERVEFLLDKKPDLSQFHPTDNERVMTALMRKRFIEADVVMRKPRREFNDMSVLSRLMVDQMAFNAYQPNNGDPAPGDYVHGWQSNAMRPIVRNKCISIAAHIIARTIYPKVFAWNSQSENQEAAATVMRDLLEYEGDCIDYPYLSLKSVLTALWSPAAITELDYGEVLDDDGERDEVYSGFRGDIVPVDELYIADFYEADIQKQPYLIRRRVKFYDVIREQYKDAPNFAYVKPGIQVMVNDANQLFYEVYDSVMRQNMVEEITYYQRKGNLKLVFLNGVIVTAPDAKNGRIDKRYPFAKFGFELLDEGTCFYFKSLTFKIQQDATIINTLYPMIIDGTYLSVMPPLLNTTGEIIPSNVVIPGAVTTLTQPNQGQITPLEVSTNLNAGLAALQQLEASIQDSVPSIVFPGRRMSAFEQAIREREMQTLLGLFTAMMATYVKQLGTLMVGDVLQHLTIGQVTDIEGEDSKLVYKAFLVPNRNKSSKAKHRRIKFDETLPDTGTADDMLHLSYGVKEEEKRLGDDTELVKVNPSLFRDLHFKVLVSPDVMSPLSEDTERAFMLEIYDRGIQNPIIDQEALTKEFLFGAFRESNRDPEKYIKKQQPGDMNNPLNAIRMQQQGGQGEQPAQPEQAINPQQPAAGGASPLNAVRMLTGANKV